MDPDLARRFPSLLWGEKEWYAVLRADDVMYHQILDDMAAIVGRRNRSQQRRGGAVLTARESVYLTAVSEGMEQVEIAERHGVTRDTVKDTLVKVRQRLGARNTMHAVAIAVGEGMIPAPKRAA